MCDNLAQLFEYINHLFSPENAHNIEAEFKAIMSNPSFFNQSLILLQQPKLLPIYNQFAQSYFKAVDYNLFLQKDFFGPLIIQNLEQIFLICANPSPPNDTRFLFSILENKIPEFQENTFIQQKSLELFSQLVTPDSTEQNFSLGLKFARIFVCMTSQRQFYIQFCELAKSLVSNSLSLPKIIMLIRFFDFVIFHFPESYEINYPVTLCVEILNRMIARGEPLNHTEAKLAQSCCHFLKSYHSFHRIQKKSMQAYKEFICPMAMQLFAVLFNLIPNPSIRMQTYVFHLYTDAIKIHQFSQWQNIFPSAIRMICLNESDIAEFQTNPAIYYANAYELEDNTNLRSVVTRFIFRPIIANAHDEILQMVLSIPHDNPFLIEAQLFLLSQFPVEDASNIAQVIAQVSSTQIPAPFEFTRLLFLSHFHFFSPEFSQVILSLLVPIQSNNEDMGNQMLFSLGCLILCNLVEHVTLDVMLVVIHFSPDCLDASASNLISSVIKSNHELAAQIQNMVLPPLLKIATDNFSIASSSDELTSKFIHAVIAITNLIVHSNVPCAELVDFIITIFQADLDVAILSKVVDLASVYILHGYPGYERIVENCMEIITPTYSDMFLTPLIYSMYLKDATILAKIDPFIFEFLQKEQAEMLAHDIISLATVVDFLSYVASRNLLLPEQIPVVIQMCQQLLVISNSMNCKFEQFYLKHAAAKTLIVLSVSYLTAEINYPDEILAFLESAIKGGVLCDCLDPIMLLIFVTFKMPNLLKEQFDANSIPPHPFLESLYSKVSVHEFPKLKPTEQIQRILSSVLSQLQSISFVQ